MCKKCMCEHKYMCNMYVKSEVCNLVKIILQKNYNVKLINFINSFYYLLNKINDDNYVL